MCGIAGILSRSPIDEERIQACLQSMGRRGPDAQGWRTWELPDGRHLTLLHARLSIIDLDARADQPMQVGRRWIAYNGELYNYKEVGEELQRTGWRPRTSSDTEVLAAALDHGGLPALDRFEGMWAFALYDAEDGSLLLSRDRFGEKPLYVHEDGETIVFASEPKAIMALLGRPLSVNMDQVRRFLVNGYKALYKKGQTFFQGLRELPPASYLHITAAARTEEKYWRPSFEPDETMTYEQAVEGVRQRLIQAVKVRLRADVPLAFCMSGGVDSNALIAIAKNVFQHDVHGFTIVNEDARYNEDEMVHAAVEHLGIRHTEIPIDTRDFLPRLRELVRYHDAPVFTITYFAHWLLMEAIRAHGYKISISGTAADELLTGYYDHHLAYLREVEEDKDLHRRSVAAWQEHIRPVVRNPHLGDPRLFSDDPTFRDHIYLDREAFAAALCAPFDEPFGEEHYTDDLLRNRMLNEMFHEAVPVILHEDDLNAMYHSVENRSPFLDRALFEFCYRIPTRHLIRDGQAKAVLRDAMAGIMEERVRTNRQKVGFNAPIHSFLDVNDPAVRTELLRDSPIFDIVRREHIEKLLDKKGLPNSQSKFLFYFLSCKMFLEDFQ